MIDKWKPKGCLCRLITSYAWNYHFDYDFYEFPFANSSDLPQQHTAKLVKT